jgi:uncharacterized membrane protein
MAFQPQADLVVNGMVLASLFFWGAWGICDKKALSYTSPVGQLAAVYCFAPVLALVLLAVLSIFSPGWSLSSHTLFYQGVGALAYVIATLAYLTAMSRGEASLIIGATASYPVLAQILANLMLGEALVPARIIGCLVAVGGIVALCGSTSSTKKESWLSLPAMKFSTDVLISIVGVILAIVGWAFRGIFDKIAIEAARPLEVNLAKYICDSFFTILLLAWIFLRRENARLFSTSVWPWAFGSAICLAGGYAAYYVALSLVSASYVITITGCYPVVMYLLAMLVLREKFNVSRAVGIVLITVGGIITQTTQNC